MNFLWHDADVMAMDDQALKNRAIVLRSEMRKLGKMARRAEHIADKALEKHEYVAEKLAETLTEIERRQNREH